MAKRNLLVIMIVYIIVVVSSVAFASEALVVEGMKEKFWRGAVNTFTGWMEFPAQIYKGYREGTPGEPDNKIGGVLFGLFDGVVHSIGRTVSGVFDLAGFWAADPDDNKGIGFPLDARYAWEEGEPYDYFYPDFKDGTLEPMWRKLSRGAGGTLLGFLELPGQIARAYNEESPDLGLIKALWYWLSREVNGISDLVSLPLPYPEDTAGVVFDEEQPWDALVDVME